MKITKNKLAILKLFNLYKHLDAFKIFNHLNTQGNNISVATIYRILASFEEKGILIKHNFNEEQSIYELANPNDHHDHLICTNCNKVIEFFDCQIEKIQEEIAKKNHFKILNHHLNLFGLCKDCNKT